MGQDTLLVNGRNGLEMQAISAVDVAQWDIKGRCALSCTERTCAHCPQLAHEATRLSTSLATHAGGAARRSSCTRGVVKLSHAKVEGECREAGVCSLSRDSWVHSAQGHVPPDGVTLGTDLSIGGRGEEVSSGTEVVADSVERSQEPLGVLG